MNRAYVRLHESGLAHSAECWDDSGQLIGGLYGVQIGKAFFGESMFSLESGASKEAFAHFAPVLFESGITVIDCQMHTQHLSAFGAIQMERETFEQHLDASCALPLHLSIPTILT